MLLLRRRDAHPHHWTGSRLVSTASIFGAVYEERCCVCGKRRRYRAA